MAPRAEQATTRKRFLAAAAVLSILPLLLAALTGTAETATSKLSEQGLFRISYTSKLDPIRINKIHSWVLHVKTAAGGPVADAEINVSGGMPKHSHGLPTAPRATRYLGDGDHLIEGMKFQMSGRWVVTFFVSAGDRSDNVSFELGL